MEVSVSRNRINPDDIYKLKYDKAKDKLEDLFQRLKKTQKDLVKERSKNTKNERLIERYQDELENVDPNYPDDNSDIKLRKIQRNLNEKDQLIEEQNLELNTLRNVKIVFEKFKLERNKDKSKMMDLEDEIKSLKNVVSGGNNEKEKLKLLMITADDLKQKNEEHLKDKEKLGEDVIKLQNQLKQLRDSETNKYQNKTGDIIRLTEDQKLRDERISILEKDRDSYYDQFKKTKEVMIQKDKELHRVKLELEEREKLAGINQSEQDAIKIQELSYIIKNLRGENKK